MICTGKREGGENRVTVFYRKFSARVKQKYREGSAEAKGGSNEKCRMRERK